MAEGSSFLNSEILEKYSENMRNYRKKHQAVNFKCFQTESSQIELEEEMQPSSDEIKMDQQDHSVSKTF